MTTPTHILNLLPDYVLDLLSPTESWQVEQHVHECAVCRAALAEERQVGLAVRQTLAIATRPKDGQLARLMPSPPVSHRPVAFFRHGQRLAAAILLLVFITIGTLTLQPAGNGLFYPPEKGLTAIAITSTKEPTSTMVPSSTVQPNRSRGASPTYAVNFTPAKTPAPAGTPIAALAPQTQN